MSFKHYYLVIIYIIQFLNLSLVINELEKMHTIIFANIKVLKIKCIRIQAYGSMQKSITFKTWNIN